MERVLSHPPVIAMLAQYLSIQDWVELVAMSRYFREHWTGSEEKIKACRIRELVKERFGWDLEGTRIDPFKHVGSIMSCARLRSSSLSINDYFLCTGGCGQYMQNVVLISRVFAPDATCLECFAKDQNVMDVVEERFQCVRLYYVPYHHREMIVKRLDSTSIDQAWEFMATQEYLEINAIMKRHYQMRKRNCHLVPVFEVSTGGGGGVHCVFLRTIQTCVDLDFEEYALDRRYREWNDHDEWRESDEEEENPFYSRSSSSSF